MGTWGRNGLKVVSATILLVCFLGWKENSCETRKNVFFVTSKALFVLEKRVLWVKFRSLVDEI